MDLCFWSQLWPLQMKSGLVKLISIQSIWGGGGIRGSLQTLIMCLIWNLTLNWSVFLMTTMLLLPFPAKNMSFSPFSIYRHLEPDGSAARRFGILWNILAFLHICSLGSVPMMHLFHVFPFGLSEGYCCLSRLLCIHSVIPSLKCLFLSSHLWPFQKQY